jgi:hypothetical protein
MESVIAKLLQDFEQGKMNRRQLLLLTQSGHLCGGEEPTRPCADVLGS